MPAMPEQHLPLIITTTNTNSNSNSSTNNNNTYYYSPGDIPPQRTYSRSTSASPPPSPTARRKRTMSSSTSSSASASPILEPRRLSITSPSASAATPHPRPRKATCTSQSHLPEAIPEHHVPEFKLQSSSASAAAAYEQDPLQIKAHLTELLNCEQVRNDPIMRQYVQSRLFESELELSMFALFFLFFSSFLLFFSFLLLPFFVFKMLTWMNRASTTKKTQPPYCFDTRIRNR